MLVQVSRYELQEVGTGRANFRKWGLGKWGLGARTWGSGASARKLPEVGPRRLNFRGSGASARKLGEVGPRRADLNAKNSGHSLGKSRLGSGGSAKIGSGGRARKKFQVGPVPGSEV